MATPAPSAISSEENSSQESKPKVSVPAVGAEVRASMLKIARISISGAPRSSRASTPAPLESIRTEETTEANSFRSTDTETTEAEESPEQDDARRTSKQLAEEKPANMFYKLQIIGFLSGLLDRLNLLMMLPAACQIADSSIKLENILEEQETLNTKKKLLAAANLVHYSLFHPIKVSKFCIEATWLKNILTATLQEMEERGTFETLLQVVEEDEAREKRLPAAIEHTKVLKEKTEMMKLTIAAETEAHKETIREWAKNLTIHKQELKEMRKQQRIAYKYKADKALATGDCARRDREIRLSAARAENVRLKADTEREKLVHVAVMDYMGKQNMALREEVLDLTATHDNDVVCLDWCLERMELQIGHKKLAIAAIEPEYVKEMAEIAAAEAAAIKKQEEFYANQGKMELSLKSAYRIQRIWRGYLVRRIYRKVLKKLKKKRLAAGKKKKKK